ncbi:MAG: helix-turn-helix transcriptional regulator [Gemmatirosa sp.]
MSLHLTHHDAAHLSATVEALLAPSVGPDPLPWWSDVEDRLRTLFGGANAMITWPQGTRLRYAGRHLDDAAQRRFEALSAADPTTGLHINYDPGVVAWFEYRRAHGVQVWHETENFHVMRAAGIDGTRGLFYNEGLVPGGFQECSGTTTTANGGEMFLTIGYDRRGRGRFGGEADADVLKLLLPAIRTAHHAIANFAPRQAALVATIDAVRDALLIVAPDGRELHRNVALRDALAGEPARDDVIAAMHARARELRAARRTAVATVGAMRPAVTLITLLARYALRATYAPALLWGVEGAVQVSLAVEDAAPHDPLPAPALQALGLTLREAEVAQLLARRLSNAELAAALGVSQHTARHHTERVMQKLGVRRRAEVAPTLLAAAS